MAHVLCLPSISYCILCFGQGYVSLLAGPSRDFRRATSCSCKMWAKINVLSEVQRWESAAYCNQMGFPPSLSTLFYTCSQLAHRGVDAYTGLHYIDLFVLMMYCSITWFPLIGYCVQRQDIHKMFNSSITSTHKNNSSKVKVKSKCCVILWGKPAHISNPRECMIIAFSPEDCIWHCCEMSWFQLVCTTSSNPLKVQHREAKHTLKLCNRSF